LQSYLFFILTLFILIEGLLSILKVGPVEKFSGWGYNPECCGDLRPNQKITAQIVPNHPYFIKTNSLGLRDNNQVSLLADKTRILAIGDSITFGPYVSNQETWPAYLEAEFENQIEVLNAGVSAYSIKEETDYLKEKGYLLKPNLVILQFFVNDISDIAKNKTRLVRQSTLSNYKYLYKIFNLLRDRSHLFAFLLDFILEKKIDKNTPESGNKTAYFKSLSEADFGQELFDEYESTFNQLLEFVNKNNLKLAVIIVPEMAQAKQLSPTRTTDFIQNLSLKNDIPVLNLQSIFYQVNQKQDLYLVPWNEHLSKYGNQLIAKETKKFIVENNLLKDY